MFGVWIVGRCWVEKAAMFMMMRMMVMMMMMINMSIVVMIINKSLCTIVIISLKVNKSQFLLACPVFVS